MIGVDTNLLVYAYDESKPEKRAIAQRILLTRTDGVLLWQVACEFVAACRKLKGASTGEAWARLAEIRRIHPLVVPTSAVLDRAAELQRRAQVQFWDGLIYAACLEIGVERLLSEDVPGQPIHGLIVENPFT
jgi:predicted nucleic acid-binding protein